MAAPVRKTQIRRNVLPVPGIDLTRGYDRPRRAVGAPSGAGWRRARLGARLARGIKRAMLLLAAVFVVGVVGYMIVEGQRFLQAVYTTSVILSTVGLALSDLPAFDSGGQILTILLIWGGVGVVAADCAVG